ncbi:MAG: hypothetical protein WC058_14150 [Phycisphaeraceae bacterium]
MDKEVLRQRLRALSDAAIEQAMAAVAQAPDGQWIAASEWPVREVFAKLTRNSYREILQARSDAHPAAAEQGDAYADGVDGRRGS